MGTGFDACKDAGAGFPARRICNYEGATRSARLAAAAALRLRRSSSEEDLAAAQRQTEAAVADARKKGVELNREAQIKLREEKQAARRALRPFDAGVSREQVRAAVQPRCAQRLCAHVQILGGKLYVVAPPSQRCPRSESAKAENDFCTMEQRRKQSGGSIATGHTCWNDVVL